MQDASSVEELKQTLNILKKALIMEREDRKENSKQIESLKSRIKQSDENLEKQVKTI